MNLNKTNHGFALMKILIAVAVIGLLASVAVVAIGNARIRSANNTINSAN